MEKVKRWTVGRSVLGWVALACLILNGLFWSTLMIDLLSPPSILSPQAIQAALSTVAFALILPLFWSMLLPSSPAGRLLQKQTWVMPGQLAVTAAAGFLTWLAARWLYLWWAAQPNIAEADQVMLLAICSLIAGVLVPALSWCVMTPEQWIAQIEQARHVKWLEHSMRMEETIMRATYARGVALLNAGLTELTIGQKKELAGILGGFARTQQIAMQQVAASWKDMYGVESAIGSIADPELLSRYKQVAEILEDGADQYAPAVRTLAAPMVDHTAAADGDTIDHPHMSHQDTADRDSVCAPMGQRGPAWASTSSLMIDHERAQKALPIARRALSGSWTRADLQAALSISKTLALNYIRAWHESDDIIKLSDPADRYEWSVS